MDGWEVRSLFAGGSVPGALGDLIQDFGDGERVPDWQLVTLPSN